MRIVNHGPVELLGRDDALAEVERRIESSRLVTIVGPGGVGKTALAQAAAERVGPNFDLGSRWVDLTSANSPELLASTVATQLDFPSFEALCASPVDRPALVVIDNCEHLIDAAAAAIEALLDACALPCVVATSRSPLGLAEESVVILAPLDTASDMNDGRPNPAAELFMRRARSAGGDVVDDAPLVAELCRRLDGLPLAIEIAAARTRSMTVTEIMRRLNEDLGVLERRRFRGSARQRSVSETIRWSYDLLDPASARLLCECSVFTGPFLARSARAVTSNDSASFEFDLDLESLVDASLLATDTTGTETRFRMLDSVRRLSRQLLEERGDSATVRARFVDHVVDTSVAALDTADRSWTPEGIPALWGRFGDIAAALDWCNAHDREPRRAIALAAALVAIVHHEHTDETLSLVRRSLDRWHDPSDARWGEAAATLATAQYLTNDTAASVALAEETLSGSTSSSASTLGLALLHRAVGLARHSSGDSTAADAFDAGARIAGAAGLGAVAVELGVAATVARFDGGVADTAGTRASLRALRDAATHEGMEALAVWAATAGACVDQSAGLDGAPAEIAAALADARRVGYLPAVTVGLRSVALAHIEASEVREAAETLDDLLTEVMKRGAQADLAMAAATTAHLAHEVGHPAWLALACSARAIPVVSVLARTTPRACPEPDRTLMPLPRRDLIVLIRETIAAIAAAEAKPEPHREPPNPSARASTNSVVARGDVYEFTFGGEAVSIRRSKGIDDIIELLSSPGVEISCLDLIGAAVTETSTGEVIDDTARRRYEDHIRDLQATVEEAERNNDFLSAERAQDELDTVVEHLTASLGLGGRVRRNTDTVERARSAVTHRIRSTIRRVDDLHPGFGRHLAGAIRTGNYCCYDPEPALEWTTR